MAESLIITVGPIGYATSVGEPKVEFDGFTFTLSMAANLPFLEMAYRARRGDKVAVELLDTFKISIYSFHYGKPYWPMDPKPDLEIPLTSKSESS